jgi:histidinol phosphatase-like enzyme
MNAVITADIVNSTLLNKESFKKLTDALVHLFNQDKIELYRGDSFQVYMNKAESALLYAVKSRLLAIQYTEQQRIDIRLSISIGDIKSDVINLGSNMEELFIKSGRYFDKFQNSSHKLSIISSDEEKNFTYEIIAQYLDSIMEKITARQAEVLYHMLSGQSQVETAKILKKTTATISQHVKTARYDEIESLLQKFKILTNKA